VRKHGAVAVDAIRAATAGVTKNKEEFERIVNDMICYLVGMGFSFVSNYILLKTFTFKSTGFYDRLKVLIR
jgi:hypothetical protein